MNTLRGAVGKQNWLMNEILMTALIVAQEGCPDEALTLLTIMEARAGAGRKRCPRRPPPQNPARRI